MAIIAPAAFVAGVSFTPAEVIGPIVGFSVLAVAAIWVNVSVLRRIPEPTLPTP